MIRILTWRGWLAAWLLSAAASAGAQSVPAAGTYPLPPDVDAAIRQFVDRHPGRAGLRAEIELTDPRARLTSCGHPVDVSLSGRNRPWGRVMFIVRCNKPVWMASVAGQVHLYGAYFVASRYLNANITINGSDIRRVEGELTAMNEDVARQADDIIGKQTTRTIQAGAAIELNNLREPAVIRAGDLVRVQLIGRGFQATGEGTALTGGAVGDMVKVKMPDGQQLQGKIVRMGVVELRLD